MYSGPKHPGYLPGPPFCTSVGEMSSSSQFHRSLLIPSALWNEVSETEYECEKSECRRVRGSESEAVYKSNELCVSCQKVCYSLKLSSLSVTGHSQHDNVCSERLVVHQCLRNMVIGEPILLDFREDMV